VSGLAAKAWYRIPFDQSELSIDLKTPADRFAECPTGSRSLSI
jgi:hypothetical protein